VFTAAHFFSHLPYNLAVPYRTAVSLIAGTRVGPYEIQSPLGAGRMGDVYRARDIRLRREVALKVLPTEFALDPCT
jgi:serine/threonine protein kinase